MSHKTVLCICDDCESVMNALTGEVFDYWQEDQEYDGIDYSAIDSIGEVRGILNGRSMIAAVIDHGIWKDVDTDDDVKGIISRYEDSEYCKLYDIHV